MRIRGKPVIPLERSARPKLLRTRNLCAGEPLPHSATTLKLNNDSGSKIRFPSPLLTKDLSLAWKLLPIKYARVDC